MSEINVNKLISTFGFKVDDKSFKAAEAKIKSLKTQLAALQGNITASVVGSTTQAVRRQATAAKRVADKARKDDYDSHVALLDRKLAAEAKSERRRRKLIGDSNRNIARTIRQTTAVTRVTNVRDAISRNVLGSDNRQLGDMRAMYMADEQRAAMRDAYREQTSLVREQARQTRDTLQAQRQMMSTSRTPEVAGVIGGLRGFSSGLMPSLAAGGAAFGSVAATRAIFRGTAELDAFESAMQNTLGSTEAAREELEWYIQTARDLKAPLVEGAKAYKTFLIGSVESGIGQEEARQVYRQTAAFGRIIGMSPDDMQGALRAYTQVASKGQLYAEELRQQLAERVPGIVSIVAHGLGVSTAELNKMMEAGEISGEMAYEALIKGFQNVITDEGMEAALSNLPSMWQGLLNSIQEFTIELREMGSSDSMKNILGNMTTFIEGFRKVAVPTLMGFLKLLEGITELLGFRAVGAVVAYLGVWFTVTKTFRTLGRIIIPLATKVLANLGVGAASGAAGVMTLNGALTTTQAILGRILIMLRPFLVALGAIAAIDLMETQFTGKRNIIERGLNWGSNKLGLPEVVPDDLVRSEIAATEERSWLGNLFANSPPARAFRIGKYNMKRFIGEDGGNPLQNLDQPTMDAMRAMGVQPSMQQSNMYNYEINIDAKGTNDPATIESTWRRVLDPLTKQLNSGSLSTPQN